jgi:hypothetical protein
MCSTRADNNSRKWRLRCGCQFPWWAFALTCVQLRLITLLGNCGCVWVASFLGVPPALLVPLVDCYLQLKQ